MFNKWRKDLVEEGGQITHFTRGHSNLRQPESFRDNCGVKQLTKVRIISAWLKKKKISNNVTSFSRFNFRGAVSTFARFMADWLANFHCREMKNICKLKHFLILKLQMLSKEAAAFYFQNEIMKFKLEQEWYLKRNIEIFRS